MSDLFERAQQVRQDYERGRQFGRYDRDVKRGKAKPPVLEPEKPSRYFLACIDCDRDIKPTRPERRVPLCQQCKDKRTAQVVQRRRTRAAR